MRFPLALGLIALATVAAPAIARSPVVAATTTPPPIAVTPGSWASQLQELATLVKPADGGCTDHCWVLDKLRLTGALDKGSVSFELDGEILARGAYDIPLFGPADRVRLENVTENGARATLGFEDGHYFVHTNAPHFALRGSLVLPEDRSLMIVGPLNSLDADLKGGRVTEGAHVTALANATIHFDAEGAPPAAQPPVFTLSRALRVGKTLEFEYKLVVQSGTDLGVVHLPLRYGERVLDVAGSTGWRVESEEVLLPTNGKHADVTITGTVANIASFTPDPRSPFEWWLLESDGEHRVLATGDAKQHDSSESPIVRKEPNSRLFLVQRGQHLDVTVQTLQSMDVLAATIRNHSRHLVLTTTGDLVAQDTLVYDNNGIDYLYFTPDGKPLYLATDNASERLMHKDGSEDLMIPMRLGQHSVTVQSLAQVNIGALFGRIAIPGPRVPLATGSEDLTFGMPASIHPLLVTGGDSTYFPFSAADGIALALSGLASALALRGWRKRGLGAATLFGLWFVSKPIFVVALGVGVVAFAWPLLRRASKLGRIGLAVATLAVVAIGVPMVATKGERAATMSGVVGMELDQAQTLPATAVAPTPQQRGDLAKSEAMKQDDSLRVGNFAAQLAHGGVLDGVRPVPLSMPGYATAAFASRQLVTPNRPFAPTIFYVTDTLLALLALVWFACAAGLGWTHREQLRALRERIRQALAAKPAPVVPATEPTPAE